MYDYTIDGKCPENCGRCCTRVLPLNDYEINKIKKYIKRNEIAPTHSTPEYCPFLNEEKKCAVYIHRGEVCKSFTCAHRIDHFNHKDKRMVDMWKEFFPELSKHFPDSGVDGVNRVYQFKKDVVYKKGEGEKT